MLADERLQLGHELAVPAERQIGVDALLQRGNAQLVEPARRRRDRLAREIGQDRATPERKRPAETPCGDLGVCRLRLGNESPEAVEVELVRTDTNQVPRRPRLEAVPEYAPQPPDVVLERSLGSGRRRVSPDAVDQPVRGNDPVGVEQQKRQRSPAPHATEREDALTIEHLQRPQDAEIHGLNDCALVVLVEAAPRLAAEPTRLHVLAEQRTRCVLRVAETLVEHLHDRHTGVEPDQIRERERAHRMVEAEAGDVSIASGSATPSSARGRPR